MLIEAIWEKFVLPGVQGSRLGRRQYNGAADVGQVFVLPTPRLQQLCRASAPFDLTETACFENKHMSSSFVTALTGSNEEGGHYHTSERRIPVPADIAA